MVEVFKTNVKVENEALRIKYLYIMKRTIDYIVTSIIGLLGIVHILLTPLFYPSLNEEANIFMGMGLAFVFLGANNLMRLMAKHKKATMVCLISNLLAVAYLIYFAAMSGRLEPQFMITILMVCIASAFSTSQLKTEK